MSHDDLIKLARHRARHTGRTFYVLPHEDHGKVRAVPPSHRWTGFRVTPIKGEKEIVEEVN